MRRAAAMCLTAFLIPYVATLAWTGRAEGMTRRMVSGGMTVLLDRGGARTAVDLEEYLIGLTAVQVPPEHEEEAIKAQAILARTAVCRQMEGKTEIPESALDMDYLEQGQMEELWGREEALVYYEKYRNAVSDTAGQVLLYNGEYIEPLFTGMAAGRTRQGDELHPYLASVETPENVEGEGYMTVRIFSREELAALLNSMAEPPGVDAGDVLENIQIIEKDGAGYVESIQVGNQTYSGDEIRYALGLPSPAFRFEAYEDQVRCTAVGIGHGYGLDQYGANRRAKEGWSAGEILSYYYQGVSLEQAY